MIGDRLLSGDEIAHAIENGQHDAIYEAAQLVAAEIRRNMPVGDPADDPHPEIALRDSVVLTPHPSGWVTISVDTPYAAKQEFDLRLKHPRGGGARYASRAITLVGGRLEQIVATHVSGKTAIR